MILTHGFSLVSVLEKVENVDVLLYFYDGRCSEA